jgi:hypothetical protein
MIKNMTGDGKFLLTEDGKILMTEDGKRILIETPDLLIKTVVLFGEKTDEGKLIEAVTLP